MRNVAIRQILTMAFFDQFISRNRNSLNRDEQEAAQILKNILYGYQNGEPDYIPDGVAKLSVGVYYQAFKRTNKKVFLIEDFTNINYIFEGNHKGIHYAGVYLAIKEAIEKTCRNPAIINSVITIRDCETAILLTLQTAAKRISEI